MEAWEVAMGDLATRYLISADQFLRMDEAGVFPPEARLELIDGEIVEMNPIGPRHAEATSRLIDSFDALGARGLRRLQVPGRMGEHGLPQPDFLIARRKPGGYSSGHPAPSDILLLVEVADSSLRFDREVKGRLYASQGIPEYWILNLVDDRLEVHRDPAGGEWRDRRLLGRGDTVAPLAFADLTVAVGDILP